MLRRVLTVAVTVAVIAGSGSAWAGTSITGPDVSSYQHPNGASIDWSSVRAAGNTFAFVKATESTGYTNPYFAQDFAGATAAGLDVGAYHFARPADSSGQSQASYFVSVTGSMQGAQDLPPVLDLEDSGGLGPSDLVAWVQAWLSEVQQLTGRVPIIYTYPSFWKNYVGSAGASLANYPLWLASYTGGSAPGTIGNWSTFTFWQYTDAATINGISGQVDESQFCCSLSNLAAYLGGTNPAASNPFGTYDSVAEATVSSAAAASTTSTSSSSSSSSSAPSSSAPSSSAPSSSSSSSAAATTSSTSSSSSPSGTPGAVVRGWAIDPDTTQPIQVSISVDGTPAATATANQSSPDVQSAYPGFGPNHRFSVAIPIGTGGDHQVCVSALNVGYGTGPTLLGCKTVTLPPTPPSAPAAAAPAFIGPNAVVVDWQSPANTNGAPVTSYALTATPQSGSGGSATPHAVSMQVPPAGSGNATSAVLSGLQAGVPYQVTVAASNSAGTGPSSSPVTVTAPAAGSTAAVCTGNEPDPFTDVASDSHKLDIDCMAARKVVQGTGTGGYAPVSSLTREQMASLLVHLLSAAGVTVPAAGASPFGDVPANDIHASAIAQLAQLGIAQGTTATTYDPTGTVTRAQMASFLARSFATAATVLPAATNDPFSDVSAQAVHGSDILAVAAAGIALGTQHGTFEPGSPVLRDQVASFLARTLDLLALVRTIPAAASS